MGSAVWGTRVVLAGALLSACGYNVYSPPARSVPLESVATLRPGQYAIAADFGVAVSVFGPSIVAASLRARRGTLPDLDTVIETNLLRVVGQPEADTREHRNAYDLRAGVQYRLASFVAVSGGLGGGAYAGGGFISPDLGVVVGYENRYLIPFLSVRGYLSQPLAARRVDLGEDEGTRRFSTPSTTVGVAVSSGLRIPLRHMLERVNPAFLLGAWGVYMISREGREFYLSPTASFEWAF